MRLLRLIRGDIRFQIKYGFYLVYGIFCALYVVLLLLFPQTWREKAGYCMIYSDPAALGLLFMGAIVLLEKSQRVLSALAVSPVRVFEYILSKVVSLCTISVLVSALLAGAAGAENMPMVLLGTALTSAVFSLLGLIIAAKINSLNQYIMAVVPAEILCVTPPVLSLFTEMKFLRFYPPVSCMALMSGGSETPILDIGIILLTVAGLFGVAHSVTAKLWRSLGGVKL